MSKYLTLDWDNIGIEEAFKRVGYILANHTNVRKLVLSFSGFKGFHVRVYLYGNSNIVLLRKAWKDDGNRLINDILNRDDNTHDILWTRKVVDGIESKEEEILTITRTDIHG